MTFFVSPFKYSDRKQREQIWQTYLEQYILVNSAFPIPFSYTELMNMPIKSIHFVFKTIEKEFDRKQKAIKQP